MALAGSLQLSHDLGLCKSHFYNKQFKSAVAGRGQRHLISSSLSFKNSFQRRDSFSFRLADTAYRPISPRPLKYNNVRCHSSIVPGNTLGIDNLKTAAVEFVRSLNNAQSGSPVHKLLPALALILFTVWGLGPLLQQSRNLLFHKNDSSWKKSKTHYVLTSYFQPLLLWTGVLLICRALDPVVLPTEASQVVKQRLLHFIGSLSTVLVFAYCLSSMVNQAQKFYMESNDSDDTRKMGFDFAGKAVYTAVWVGAISLFMELLGFSTQKWLTAGGLGTVLLTLAGREIFTNFLSSAMIHATRPFVVNEWIQTRIEGYDVSGTVEHVGWWSPTIVRGEDREAVHIPNHKFTMNVVRNLTQKTHWRIKTHLAISHLDVKKINNIVADMRKVLAKNPQVEQQKLHRRVFLENVNAENQALLILISCFVKTSHFEEYLCVKEGILLDLLRVISHHRARLATPIRTVQKIYSDPDLDNIPFAESIFNRGGGVAPNRPLLLIEPSYKINGEEKAKTQPRSARPTGEEDTKPSPKPPSDNNKTDAATAKVVEKPASDNNKTDAATAKVVEKPASDIKVDPKSVEEPSPGTSKDPEAPTTPPPNPKVSEKVTTKATSATTPVSKSNSNVAKMPTSDTSQANQSKKASAGNGKASESQAPTRPAMEENILLEVVLEGSKRTLPIDEEMGKTPEEAKELAAHRSKNGSQGADKDKKDGSQVSSAPDSAAPGDQ